MKRAIIITTLAIMLTACGGDDAPADRSDRVRGDALKLWSAYDEVRHNCTENAARRYVAGDGANPCVGAAVLIDASRRLESDPCVRVPRGAKWVPLVDVVDELATGARMTGFVEDAAALEAAARRAPSCSA